jgi:hypothetical protein
MHHSCLAFLPKHDARGLTKQVSSRSMTTSARPIAHKSCAAPMCIAWSGGHSGAVRIADEFRDIAELGSAPTSTLLDYTDSIHRDSQTSAMSLLILIVYDTGEDVPVVTKSMFDALKPGGVFSSSIMRPTPVLESVTPTPYTAWNRKRLFAAQRQQAFGWRVKATCSAIPVMTTGRESLIRPSANGRIGYSAKQETTRTRRIERAVADLRAGKRRPCCWPGCPHRRPSAKKWFERRAR